MVSSRPPHPGSAVHCADVRKAFADVIAVDGLNLDVDVAECFGLLGPNGAGKTTSIEMIEGLQSADSGVVEVLGQRWGTGHDSALRHRLGIQLQETQLPDKLTVEETVRLFRSFYRHGRSIDAILDMVELQPKRRARVGKLSGGQKQRLALACALVSDPDLLFLDEPTTGLDPQARLKVWEVVEAFRARGGTVLMTTHYMEEAARLCNRIAIVDRGRVVAVGTPQELIGTLDAEQIIEFLPAAPVDETRLAGLASVRQVRRRGEHYVLSVGHAEQALPALLAAMQAMRVPINRLTTYQATLEDVFVHLTGRALRDE